MNYGEFVSLGPERSAELEEDFHWAKIVEGIQGYFLLVWEAGTELHLPDLSGWWGEDNIVKTREAHIPDLSIKVSVF